MIIREVCHIKNLLYVFIKYKIERSEDSKSGEDPAFVVNARPCIYIACPCCFTPLLVKVRRTGKMQKNLAGSMAYENVV